MSEQEPRHAIAKTPTDEDLVESIRTTASLLHGYIRVALSTGLQVSMSAPIGSEMWNIKDIKIRRDF